MIDSKKINVITIVLLIIALCVTAFIVLKPVDENIGVRVYADGDEAVLDADDFYTNTASGVTKINLDSPRASGNVLVNNGITIMSGGTYVLSGAYEGSITIDTTDNKTVRLVLDGANITSLDAPAIYVKNAGKVVISTAENTDNTIADGDTRLDEELNATVYSKDTLTFNGLGTLVINGNFGDAIKGNDDIKITGGNISITAVDDGINANDYILFDDGSIKIDAKGDAVKSGNDEKKGFIAVDGGEIELTSGDDALHAEGTLYANGGSVNVVNCLEGFEGYAVVINGGDHRIVSRDDAINAAADGSGDMRNEKNHTDTVLTVNGGKLYVETGGDGLDSNGAAVVNGGEVCVFGPENNGNSSMDFDSSFIINGGILKIAGSSGMAEPPSENSTQNTIVAYLTENYDSASTVVLADANGNNVIEFTSPKRFDWVCISSSDIKTGEEYTLSVNGTSVGEAAIENVITTIGERAFGGMGGFGGFGGGFGGKGGMGGRMPQGEMPEDFTPPEGMERPQMPERPDGEMPQRPDGMERPQRPEGEIPRGNMGAKPTQE